MFNEPWSWGTIEDTAIINITGSVLARPIINKEEPRDSYFKAYFSQRTWDRIISCINGMKKIKNPSIFVEKAKELREKAVLLLETRGVNCSCQMCEWCKLDSSVAKFDREIR